MERANEDEFVSFDVAVSRLIGELTEHRCRQRALIDTLAAGRFTWDLYVQHIREVRKRDFDALFEAMVLQPNVFRERHEQWIQEDTERYLFRIDVEEAGSLPAATKKRRRVSKRQ